MQRWRKEYLSALRERHKMTHKAKKFQPQPSDVVILQSDNKNRGAWPLAIVEETFAGKDNVIRAVRVKTKNGSLEKAVQHLFPKELSCDTPGKTKTFNTKVAKFNPRPKRDAAVAARLRTKQVAEADEETLD